MAKANKGGSPPRAAALAVTMWALTVSVLLTMTAVLAAPEAPPPPGSYAWDSFGMGLLLVLCIIVGVPVGAVLGAMAGGLQASLAYAVLAQQHRGGNGAPGDARPYHLASGVYGAVVGLLVSILALYAVGRALGVEPVAGASGYALWLGVDGAIGALAGVVIGGGIRKRLLPPEAVPAPEQSVA